MFRYLVTMFVILVSLIDSAVARQRSHSSVDLASRTEMFILKHKKSREDGKEWLYIRTLNLGGKNIFGWVEYDHKSPKGKLFQISHIDKMTYPVKSLDSAFYYVLTDSIVGYIDNKTIGSKKEGRALKKRMRDYLYTSLANYLPVSNANVVDRAVDLYNACPAIPNRKNGRSCARSHMVRISNRLKNIIAQSAKRYNQSPALMAAIIQHESQFNPFIENLHEKRKCKKAPKSCSPYRWGKGLSQLGATDAHFFGLDWNHEVSKPRVCRGKTLLNSRCLRAMLAKCKKYKNNRLQPVNCPVAAIDGVARKLKSLIPSRVDGWVMHEASDGGISKLINLSPVLRQTSVEKLRNLVGLYNRGVKVYNSYVEYYDNFGSFPNSFGAAWSMARVSSSPSISMGYQMLTREYIGRCYVWDLAGLCGKLPNESLIKQYQSQF